MSNSEFLSMKISSTTSKYEISEVSILRNQAFEKSMLCKINTLRNQYIEKLFFCNAKSLLFVV